MKNELTAKEDFDINDVNKHQIKSYAKKWEQKMNLGAKSNNSAMFINSMSSLETMKKDLEEKKINSDKKQVV